MNTRFLLLRILVSPIIFALILVGHTYSAVKRFYLFIRYGGEFITFENNERPTIEKIYQKLKEATKL
ncbi:MAG TPA: hypothetical protein PK548_05540 [Bacteroidales bacterium]|nr:hypothetical protein [Bacteroidales bacterium]